jgi:hypothetical protein
MNAASFWVRNAGGIWMRFSTDALRRHLNVCGLNGRGSNGTPSAVDVKLHEIQMVRCVEYAGPLAGYRAGVHEVGGSRVLVTCSPRIIEPQTGDCGVILAILENMFGGDQLRFFLAWAKLANGCLRTGHKRAGQALVMAGERDCGKSLVQNFILTPLLGGRTAKPYQYMSGLTTFNGDLFEAEHLMVEDEVASTDIRSRRNFGAHIKQVAVNIVQRMHRKHCQALTLEPFWRLTITCNDEPEHLMILPPMDESIRDKVMLLRAVRAEMPMPTGTDEERRAFTGRIAAEMPAFVDYLIQWKIPSDIASVRYGVEAYHHEQVMGSIDELAPETKLLNLIDAHLPFGIDDQWSGGSEMVEKVLRDADRATCDRLLTYNTACGVYLARLAKRHPERIQKHKSHHSREWTILRASPEEDADPATCRFPVNNARFIPDGSLFDPAVAEGSQN